MSNWVDAAQVVSGFAALAAVWLSVVTARSARRVPLTDAYMSAWQAILEVLSVATDPSRAEPLPEDEADLLMRQFRAADHHLSVIEATLRVRVYGRVIRHQLTNLLIDVLYDNPEIREASADRLTVQDMPREDWATCSDEEWLRVVNSVPFASMLVSQVWDVPGQRDDDHNSLMRWYYPTVLESLNSPNSVTAPSAPPQQQLTFFLRAYVDYFLLPWIRDASREALMGRLGLQGYRALWRGRLRHWRHVRQWRDLRTHGHLGLFEPTSRRR